MSRPLSEDDSGERAAVDGRVAFAIVAFAAAIGLSAVLDRVGAPEGLVRAVAPLFIVTALATTGVLLRTVLVSRFYAAGRRMPTPYVGFGVLAIVAGLATPFLPPSPAGTPPVPMAVGAAVGIAAAVLLLGPYLRKTGAFSVVDLANIRFPNVALRWGLAVTVAAVGSLAGLAGFEIAIETAGSLTGLPRPALAAALAFILVLTGAPGGLSGTVWAANGAAAAALAAIVLPLAALVVQGDVPTPLMTPSPLWGEAARLLTAWDGSIAATDIRAPAIGAAMAAAVLLPLLTGFASGRNGRAALRGGILGLAWSAVLSITVAAALLWGAILTTRTIVGQAPDRLPDVIYAASAAGAVAICGAPAGGPVAARQNCGGRAVLGPADVKPLKAAVLLGLTGRAGLGAASTGLLLAAFLAVGLAVAAAGFLLCAAGLGQDLFLRAGANGAQSSRRLAVTRAFLVATVAIGSAATGLRILDPRLLIGVAGTLAAAAILPLLLLSMHPRAIGRDAFVALAVGVAGAELVLFGHALTLDLLMRAAFVGGVAGTAAGFLVSFVTRGDRTESRAFVAAVLQRRGDVLAPDKGA